METEIFYLFFHLERERQPILIICTFIVIKQTVFVFMHFVIVAIVSNRT